MPDALAILKALADRNRLRIVAALARCEELCACQISDLLAVSGPTASRHLGLLIDAGVLASRKQGRWVFYSLCDDAPEHAALLQWVEQRQTESPEAEEDRRRLAEITAVDPETYCSDRRCCD